ncbi:hypothetical protein JG687_00010716 [Phytophthora cactorum]|uniref:Uncharacterized protein n=1 Tax=Phytophthora cactorum TaxID=29920 RepID=A0A8T1U8B3_9STRA|nr:hypothetical protein JG687_00010716 [Phytophthora cactorum]
MLPMTWEFCCSRPPRAQRKCINHWMLLSSFIPFKSTVKNVMTSRLLNTADLVLPTKASIAIACSVYQSSITYRPDNEISSFKSTGLFPPSLVNMTKCLDVNSTGGARGTVGKEACLKRKQADVQVENRSESLILPPAAGGEGRRTVDIDGELVSNEASS